MKFSLLVSLLMTAVMMVACGSHKKDKKEDQASASVEQPAAPTTLAESDVQTMTTSWSATSKDILSKLTAKYGQPNEATDSMLIWHNNGPWKKTVLHNESGANVLEQFADMRVQPEKLGEVALYNKNVVVDRNNGEISARSDREEMNFLAINLAREVVDGRMSAMEARRQYRELSDMTQRNQYMDTLNFGNESPTGTGSGTEEMQAEEADSI